MMATSAMNSGRLATRMGVNVEEMRSLTRLTFYQIEFLRRRRDNGRKGRFSLLAEIASNLASMSNGCDLPGGYSDPDDPFADEALKMLRAEFEELRNGDYPVPDGVPVIANGRRL